MTFAGINYLGVLAAALAGWIAGAAWYGVLGRPWLAALGKTKADLTPSPMPFVVSFAAELVMAWVLAGLIGHFGPGAVTPSNGVVSAAFVWLGFVATTLLVNHRFSGAKPALTLIDGGHWLVVLLIMGAVIGLIGV